MSAKLENPQPRFTGLTLFCIKTSTFAGGREKGVIRFGLEFYENNFYTFDN